MIILVLLYLLFVWNRKLPHGYVCNRSKIHWRLDKKTAQMGLEVRFFSERLGWLVSLAQGWNHAAADATTIFFAAIAPAAFAFWIAVFGSWHAEASKVDSFSLLRCRLRYQPLMQLPGLLAQPVQQQLLGALRFSWGFKVWGLVACYL